MYKIGILRKLCVTPVTFYAIQALLPAAFKTFYEPRGEFHKNSNCRRFQIKVFVCALLCSHFFCEQ